MTMQPQDEQIKNGSSFSITVISGQENQRIDKFITNHFSQYSRSFLQKLFSLDHILVSKQDESIKKSAKASYNLKIGDQITILFPEEKKENQVKDIPSDINVTIIAKEKDFLIISKPAGLVVHAPNKNYQDVTLSDWVVGTHDEIAHVGLIDRPGIVHRLDKDTSGLMIIPRTNLAHATLTDMFKERKIHKTYLTIVVGHPPAKGTIDFFIGRHPVTRNKMHHFTAMSKTPTSRQSKTNYEVITYFKDYSLVKVEPITGRTHQIRVHFAAIGFPIFSDFMYGKTSKLLKRHALHAHKLEFNYASKDYSFVSPLEPDLQSFIDSLQPIIS
ncbi:MAG: RluA family pseudouridine synthase [Candidatus Dependentiae bacterium]|nr:RluA family pseudouridine synthase [Candidatus Dependentiae bacterium]